MEYTFKISGEDMSYNKVVSTKEEWENTKNHLDFLLKFEPDKTQPVEVQER